MLYGPFQHPPHSQQQDATPPQHYQHPQQLQGALAGVDCGGWQAAASPRAPLAAVNGWQAGGSMQWEAAAGGASRKRGHEAAMGGPPSGGLGAGAGVGGRAQGACEAACVPWWLPLTCRLPLSQTRHASAAPSAVTWHEATFKHTLRQRLTASPCNHSHPASSQPEP